MIDTTISFIKYNQDIDNPHVQGSIVCIFYCVLSNDVRMAVTKRWYQFKVRRDHARDHQRQANILLYKVTCVSDSPSVPILRPLHVTDGKLGLTLSNM